MFRLKIASVTFSQQIIALENILFQRYYFPFIVMMVVMFMSVPVFMVMKVIVMMMLSASSTHKRLSFYFITIDLIRSSRPFVIFIK